jgi:hypothetical protein
MLLVVMRFFINQFQGDFEKLIGRNTELNNSETYTPLTERKAQKAEKKTATGIDALRQSLLRS